MLEHRWIDGRRQHPTLVLLHEGLGSVAMWRDFPDALAERTGCRTFVYSRAGHGKSPPPTARRSVRFMHEEALGVLPDLLDTFRIDDPILIGHSDGASIALIYAAGASAATTPRPEAGIHSPAGSSPVAPGTRPLKRPRGLVLLAPHVFVEDCSIESIRRMRELYSTTDLRARLAKYHDDVDAAFYGWSDVWLDPAFRQCSIEDHLPRITCPVLVIQGEDDEYGTRRQVDAIAAGVGGSAATLMLTGCGHAPHRDQREVVLERVARFIAEA